jgi:hypothetical protein
VWRYYRRYNLSLAEELPQLDVALGSLIPASHIASVRSQANGPRPCLLNSAVGLITTLVNIYTARGGRWSATSIVTASATGICALITSVLYVSYALKVHEALLEHKQLNKMD